MNGHRGEGRWWTPAVIVGVVLATTLGLYIVTYWKSPTDTQRQIRVRVFRAKWQCAVFSPAARFEAIVTSYTVLLMYQRPGGREDLYGEYMPVNRNRGKSH
jgi:hypothetical protein